MISDEPIREAIANLVKTTVLQKKQGIKPELVYQKLFERLSLRVLRLNFDETIFI